MRTFYSLMKYCRKNQIPAHSLVPRAQNVHASNHNKDNIFTGHEKNGMRNATNSIVISAAEIDVEFLFFFPLAPYIFFSFLFRESTGNLIECLPCYYIYMIRFEQKVVHPTHADKIRIKSIPCLLWKVRTLHNRKASHIQSHSHYICKIKRLFPPINHVLYIVFSRLHKPIDFFM